MTVRIFAESDPIYAIQVKCPQAAQWRPEDYLQLAGVPGGTILVAELESAVPAQIVGFTAFHRVLDEAELRNLAVEPMHQRKGVARALLMEGIRILRESGVRQIFLEVRASNQPARALYESVGFQSLHVRHRYYHDPEEDALVMACDISPSLEVLSPPKP